MYCFATQKLVEIIIKFFFKTQKNTWENSGIEWTWIASVRLVLSRFRLFPVLDTLSSGSQLPKKTNIHNVIRCFWTMKCVCVCVRADFVLENEPISTLTHTVVGHHHYVLPPPLPPCHVQPVRSNLPREPFFSVFGTFKFPDLSRSWL